MTDGQFAALLCFDFDGTLVDRPSEPQEIARLEAFLAHMHRRGAAWGINTGRTLAHTLEGLREHGFQSLPDYIIARECEIYRRSGNRGWTDFGDWNMKCTEDHRRFHKAHTKFYRLLERQLAHEIPTARFISDKTEPAGVVSSDEATMDKVVRWIESQRGDWPEMTYQRNSIWLRFTRSGYDKGSALTEVRRLTSIGAAYTFAAGDNHNDLPMLQTFVAHGIACPANAIPEISSHVDDLGGFVAPHRSTTGVIAAIEHYFYPDESEWSAL
jgi:HAD superfamily hydrolase (TIGR01484 family)